VRAPILGCTVQPISGETSYRVFGRESHSAKQIALVCLAFCFFLSLSSQLHSHCLHSHSHSHSHPHFHSDLHVSTLAMVHPCPCPKCCWKTTQCPGRTRRMRSAGTLPASTSQLLSSDKFAYEAQSLTELSKAPLVVGDVCLPCLPCLLRAAVTHQQDGPSSQLQHP